MSKIHKLPDAEQVEREASDWIMRLTDGNASGEDHFRFERWVEAHLRHARAFEDLAATWSEFKSAAPLVRAVSFGNAMNAATEAYPGWTRQTIRRSALRRGFALAAGVLVLLAATVWWMVEVAPGTQIQTAVGERATVQLPDGSTLELNSNSLARVQYTKTGRIVRLKRGEAFFDVAHGDPRPFWTVADRAWVRAVGTAFTVYKRTTDVRIIVSEGTVKVSGMQSPKDSPTDSALTAAPVSVLKAGQQAWLQGAAADIRMLSAEELMRSMAWREGKLTFADVPLGAAVEEMNRYTTVQLVLKDDKLREIPIGGTFEANAEGAEALLQSLKDGFGLTVVRDRKRRAHIEAPP